MNIQCRMVDGPPKVFEINPRFSGGIPLTIAAGADFPAMLVDLALGRRVAPAIGQLPRRPVDVELRDVAVPRAGPAGAGTLCAC